MCSLPCQITVTTALRPAVSSRAAAVAAVPLPSSSALFGKRSIVDELKDIEENADGSSGDGDAASSAQKAKKEKVSGTYRDFAAASLFAISSGVLSTHID
jgi:hypothetical protein